MVFGPVFLMLVIVALILCGAILGVAYTAYRARVVQERQEVVRPYAGPDPIDALVEANDALEREAGEARRSAERARDAVRRGVRG